jgi:Uma2 family endonuclease
MSGVVARKPPGGSTLADLLAIPEEERSRYELLDGEVVEREAATGEHGGTQSDLVAFLHARFSRRPGGRWPGGWWFATEVDISFDEVNTLRPDVLGWRRDRHPRRPGGYPVTVLPDWTCEVLSSNKRNDLIKKKRVYHQHRVPHYWILDPAEGTLLVYRWTEEGYTEVLAAERGEIVRAEPFDAVDIPVNVFFGEDDDLE